MPIRVGAILHTEVSSHWTHNPTPPHHMAGFLLVHVIDFFRMMNLNGAFRAFFYCTCGTYLVRSAAGMNPQV